MSWREAWLLTKQLLGDPSSRAFVAVAGWPHPWSREAFLLADLYDLLAAANTDRRFRRQLDPYPRPTGQPRKNGGRLGRATRSQQEVRALLRARGHGQVGGLF